MAALESLLASVMYDGWRTGVAVESLTEVRSFSRDQAARARALARACLETDDHVAQPSSVLAVQHSSPKHVVLHDEHHFPVHNGLSQPFLAGQGVLHRARRDLTGRIEAREHQLAQQDNTNGQQLVELPLGRVENQSSLVSSYTPRY